MKGEGEEDSRGQPPSYTTSNGVRGKERYIVYRKIKAQGQKVDGLT